MFGIDPNGIIKSLGSAFNALAPAPSQDQGFAPANVAVGGFTPAGMAGGGFAPANLAAGGFQPAQGPGGSGFQPSGFGNGGGFQPSGFNTGGFGPSNWQGQGFQPASRNASRSEQYETPKTPTTGSASGAASKGVKSAQWGGMVNEEAAKYADAPELAEVAQAVMELESSGNPDAEGVVVTQGPYAGQRAQGLMQIMPGNYPGVNLKDPRTNIQKGLEMLYQRYKQYGNWDSAVASYFGAVDSQGRPTTQADDNGTTGIQYVSIVNQNRATIKANAASRAPEGSKGLTAVVGGLGWQNMQDFGPTPYAQAHQSTYDYSGDYGMGPGQHTGIDMAVPSGTRSYSPVSGTVITAGGTNYYTFNGRQGVPGEGELRIQLDNGDQIILGHMSNITLHAGQRINAGDFVGLSGGSDGDHIHLEVRKVDHSLPSGYRIVDPRSYFGG